jgi:hypothetical protein
MHLSTTPFLMGYYIYSLEDLEHNVPVYTLDLKQNTGELQQLESDTEHAV